MSKNAIPLDYLRACFEAGTLTWRTRPTALAEAFVVALGLALSGNLSTPCFAQAFQLSAVGAATVTNSCRQAGDPMRIECSGYILGVFDQMVLSQLICPPSNPSGMTAQAVAVALKLLNDHPEKWDRHPAVLIGESFKAAFPCGG
jgi:hypothetical protein